MASPPNRTDLAGTPSVATYKLAIGALYDYVASLLGNGTAAIATEAEQTKAREYLGVGSTGFKNRFINPEFLIDQRNAGASIAIPISATPKYLVDRWYGLTTGAAITAQQIAGISERQKSLRFTGATGNTGLIYGQRIESFNCADFKNKNISVSLKAKASGPMVITWTASYATVSDTFATVTPIATGSFNVTTSVGDFNFSFNAGANVGNGLEIKLSTTALLAGATIDFDQMQIEKANVFTEFQTRPYQVELAICQRYYEFLPYNNYLVAGTSGGSVGVFNSFKVSKRASPTVSITDLAYVLNSSNLVAISIGYTGFQTAWESGNATIHSVIGFGWVASAEL